MKLSKLASQMALQKAIDTAGMSLRPKLIDGARNGIKDHIKRLKKKGKDITIEAAVSEIANDKKFLGILQKVDITLDDLKDIAADVIEKMSAEPVHSEKIGRNDPCPCGSGLKYKRCCMIVSANRQ